MLFLFLKLKSRHNSLSRQNSVQFGTDFTPTRKKFTLALLARLYVFPSLNSKVVRPATVFQLIQLAGRVQALRLDGGFLHCGWGVFRSQNCQTNCQIPASQYPQTSECGRQRTLNMVHAQTAAQQQSNGKIEARMSGKCGEWRD